MEEDTKLLKRDCLGRVLVPADQKEKMLDAFEASSLSGVEFARKHGVPPKTFRNWIQKRRGKRGLPLEKKGGARKSSLNLIEVTPQPPRQSSGLEITLPSGAKVQVSEEGQIPLLKTLMRELSC